MTESKALVFVLLCIFRLVNAFFIQTQFDPDEYWQTLEPAYCRAFGDSCSLTWEWTRRASLSSLSSLWEQSLNGPVRSHLAILPTYLLYTILKLLHVDTPFMVSKGPLLVHAVLIAAPTDYFVWYLGDQISSSRWSLFCSVTSWFQAFALVRTYSNSIETVLLMAGIVLLRSQNKGSDALAFVLGGMSVAIRFTSLAAWLPLGVLFALHNSASLKSRVVYLIYPCAVWSLVGIGLSVLVDRCFYGFWTLPLLGNLHFNVVEGMGALYGSHPFHWYLTAAIPAITGLMLPFLVYAGLRHGLKNNLWIVVSTYIVLHSISAHKELRFLLPILPLLCIFSGKVLSEELNLVQYPKRKLIRRLLIGLFLVANAAAFLYLGTIHQRAPIDVNKAIVHRIQKLGKDDITVHYLLSCHSTPLYSHLHVRGVHIQAWHLDCSPTCRASETLVCESAAFERDPVAFVQGVYGDVCNSFPVEDREHLCHSIQATVPNFLAIFARDAVKVDPQLVSMGLKVSDRFFHSIGGLKFFGMEVGETALNSRSLSDWLVLRVDEIVLYERLVH
jgi:GPI mannosyltransferase 3